MPPLLPAANWRVRFSVQLVVAEHAAATIPSWVTCVGCGYGLSGLEASAVCPECATPVRESLAGDRLEHLPKDHLVRVRRGLALIVVAVPIVVMSWVLPLIAWWLGAWMPRISVRAVVIGELTLATLSMALFAWGVVRLSTREPRYRGVLERSWLRRLAPWTVMAPLVGWILPVTVAHFRPELLEGLPGVVKPFVVVLQTISWTPPLLATVAFARSLSLRVPNPALADRATKVMRTLVIVTIFIGLMAFPFSANDFVMGLNWCVLVPTSGVMIWVLAIYSSVLGALLNDLSQIVATGKAPPAVEPGLPTE